VETYTVEVAVQWPPNLRNTDVLQQFGNLDIVHLKGITREHGSPYTGKDSIYLHCVKAYVVYEGITMSIVAQEARPFAERSKLKLLLHPGMEPGGHVVMELRGFRTGAQSTY